MQLNNAERCPISGNIFRRTRFGGVTKAKRSETVGTVGPLTLMKRRKTLAAIPSWQALASKMPGDT